MEPAVVLAIVMLVASAASLAIDLSLEGCVRLVHGRYGVPRPIRKMVAGAVVVMVVWSLRPATGMAVVPPPSVRITGVEPGAPADIRVDLGAQPLVGTSSYIVERGDCLWRIARRLLAERYGTAPSTEIAVLWRSIYEANRAVIGNDPDLIVPGQTLALPGGW